MKNKNIGFGIFLLSIGVILLLMNIGIINWTIFESLFELWPVVLIVIGINIIFHNNEIVKIITWLAFLTVVLAHSYFFNGGYYLNSAGWNGSESIKIEKKAETERGDLKIELSGSKLSIDSTNTSLVDADLSDQNIKHKVDYNDGDKKAHILFEEKYPFGININGDKDNCKFSLNESVVWDMDIDTGAVNGTLDMSNLKVENLDIDVGAANLKLIFGSKYKPINVELDAGASNIDVVIPQNAGVKVKIDAAFSNTNLKGLGWNRQGDYYISPNYDSSETQIDFDVDMGAGKFDVSVQ